MGLCLKDCIVSEDEIRIKISLDLLMKENPSSSNDNLVDMLFDEFRGQISFKDLKSIADGLLSGRNQSVLVKPVEHSNEDYEFNVVDDLSFVDFDAFGSLEIKEDNSVDIVESNNGDESLKDSPLAEMMQEGLIVPQILFPTVEGFDVDAVLVKNGEIKVGEKFFKSPTKAAAAAGYSKRKNPEHVLNGWRFWGIKVGDKIVSLAEIRNRARFVDEI